MDHKDDFNRLVKEAARQLYNNLPIGSEGKTIDVLDALTRNQWVCDRDLAAELNLDAKKVIPILKFLEEEKMIQRDTLREVKRQRRMSRKIPDGRELTFAKVEKLKIDKKSYCCINYPEVHNAVRHRVHTMIEKMKKESSAQNSVQQYICIDCNKKYSSLDVLDLVSTDGDFRCERCDTILETVGDNMAIKSEKFSELLENVKEELKPVASLLEKLNGLDAPTVTTLQQWKGAVQDENVVAGVTNTPTSKVEATNVGSSSSIATPNLGTKLNTSLPSWMIREGGLNFTEEQMQTVKIAVQGVLAEDEVKQDSCVKASWDH